MFGNHQNLGQKIEIFGKNRKLRPKIKILGKIKIYA